MTTAVCPDISSISDIFHFTGLGIQYCQSVGMLADIFQGPIQTLTNGGAYQDATNLGTIIIGAFNYAIMWAIFVLFGYITWHGVISSANEGKFGGREMGHWSYAIRACVSPACFFPIKGGFCLLQYLLMYVILVGTNVADYVWSVGIKNIHEGAVPTTPQAIRTAIAEKVGAMYVAAAVAQVMEQKLSPSDVVTFKASQVSVWNSPYAGSAYQKMYDYCDTAYDPAVIEQCKTVVDQMRSNGLSVGYGNLSQNGKRSLVLGIKQPKATSYDGMLDIGGSASISQASGTHFWQYTSSASDNPMNCFLEKSLNPAVVCDTGTYGKPGCQNAMKTIQGVTDSPQVCSGGSCLMSCQAQALQKVIELDQQNGTPILHAINNDWWTADQLYLTITQELAKNIQVLAQKVEDMPPPAGQLMDFRVNQNCAKDPSSTACNPEVVFTMIDYLAQYYGVIQFDGKMGDYEGSGGMRSPSQSLTSLVPGGSQVYMNETKGGVNVPNKSYTLTSGSTQPHNATAFLNSLPWDKLVQCYADQLPSTLGQGITIPGINKPNPLQICAYIAIHNITIAPKSVTFGSGSTGAQLVTVPTGYPIGLKDKINQMPAVYQNPMKILMVMNLKGFINTTEFIQYFNNIVTVLSANHIYPGTEASTNGPVSSKTEINPARKWMDKVFDKLLGQNMPLMGNPTGKPTSGILYDIYQLGNQKKDLKSLTSESLNTMANAQKVGLEMIGAVTASLLQSYAHINSQLTTDEYEDLGIGAGVAVVAGAAAATGWVGGSLGSTIATLGQTALQMKMAVDMLSITKELAWLPIVMVVLSSMFVAGISFAVILPLMPFFLLWAGQLAWLIGVIEAMVAAPLMILALMVPGGHQHFGYMTPGLRMLFGVVFRPVLMVIGFFMGIILTYIVISFSSHGFQLVATQIINFAGTGTYETGIAANSSTMTQGIIACLLLFTFCSFMMMAFTKCFSMIYVLPEKVVTWIGASADKAGAQELQQMNQGMTQSAQSGASAGGQSTEKSIGAEQKFTGDMGGAASHGAGAGAGLGQSAKPPKGTSTGKKGVSTDDN